MRSLIAAVERIDPLTIYGRVAAVNGLLIEVRGGLTPNLNSQLTMSAYFTEP